MQNILAFSGRSSRRSYGLFTLAFAAIVLGLLAGQSDTPFTQLLSTPWLVLGRAVDDLIQIPSASIDFVVSIAVTGAFLWMFAAMTVCRLRDIGQSPWWTILVMLSGIVVLAMIALSLVPPADRAAAKEAAAGLSARAATRA
ncbi:MAG TPA: DUF805 domain-containing protein [Brevundimonas sp.]|jgi:uncharacterized membrane protein YhaH (DUF805 family)